MSVSNGQQASAATFNGAFVSKTADSTVSGVITQDKESVLKEIATPATPSSGYGKIYFKSDGKLYQLNDAGTETQVGSGAGGGGVNFITNGDAEGNATTGWAVYADAAGTSPVDGTGGSANVTIAATGTTPLAGNYSFLMAKDAVNRQGQGWSYDFTIDQTYRAKVLQISFDYLVSSGTFSAGSSSANSDVTVWIYDVTNAVLIQPSNIKLFSNNASITDKFQASFQTASNSSSYRLIFHVASTSASAYTLEVDNVSVGPSTYVFGTPVTDGVSYTPTFGGFGTVTNVDIQWRKIGDMAHISGRFTAGTVAASTASFTLPPGLVSQAFSAIRAVGYVQENVTTTTWKAILASPSTNTLTFGMQNASNAGLSSVNGSTAFATGEVISFYAQVPIAGWSSSVQTSDSADTRVVAAARNTLSSTTITGGTALQFTTSSFDTHAAFTSNSTFTVPVSGFYRVTVSGISSSTTASNLEIFVNGATQGIVTTVVTAGRTSGSGVVSVKAGDTITIVPSSSVTAGTTNGQFYIERLSGPSAIAATETVAAGYYITSNQAVSTTTRLNFDTKIFDTHSFVTTGASWLATVPVSGKYQVILYAYSGTAAYDFVLWKNGSANIRFAAGTTNQSATASCLIDLIAGDNLQIRPNSSITVIGNASLDSTTAKIFINRIGN